MKKWLLVCLVLAVISLICLVNADYQALTDHVVRLHVVANSDTSADQALKLQARDAIQAYLSPILTDVEDTGEAKRRIQENLTGIERAAQSVLPAGTAVTVTLEAEVFDTRHYDTFSLPAGVYDALRVTIGAGAGHNWWCVVFPDFCYGDLTGAGQSAGLSGGLLYTLRGDGAYRLRFGLVDLWGSFLGWFHK